MCYFIFTIYNSYNKSIINNNLKDASWINKNVNIVLSNTLGSNIYEIKKDKNITIDNNLYQNVIDKKINELFNNTYNFNSPLIILNPYGTNNLVLDKVGNFTSQAGQHTITYVHDEVLEDGKYYLEMYNNNYGSCNTRDDFTWDSYEGVGRFNKGTNSKYYKYLIDENKGTYELVKTFDVDYSSIVSSVQDILNNYVTSSGKSNSFAEYDNSGNLIKQFIYTSKKYAYRVFKYNFNNIWFSKK